MISVLLSLSVLCQYKTLYFNIGRVWEPRKKEKHLVDTHGISSGYLIKVYWRNYCIDLLYFPLIKPLIQAGMELNEVSLDLITTWIVGSQIRLYKVQSLPQPPTSCVTWAYYQTSLFLNIVLYWEFHDHTLYFHDKASWDYSEVWPPIL